MLNTKTFSTGVKNSFFITSSLRSRDIKSAEIALAESIILDLKSLPFSSINIGLVFNNSSRRSLNCPPPHDFHTFIPIIHFTSFFIIVFIIKI